MKPVSLNKKISIGGLHLLQSLLFLGIGTLQRFTHFRPMLMRHLYTRKVEYTEVYFSNGLLLFQSIFLVLLFLGLLCLLLRKRKSIKGLLLLEGLIFTVLPLVSLVFIHLDYFKELITYPYWIFAGYLLLIFQGLIQLILQKKRLSASGH